MITPEFTIIWLPDTQYYCSTYPATFTAQTNWIVNNKEALNIQFVLHVGDVVDTGSSNTQWIRASNSLAVLDNDDTIPYLLAVGNHDYNTVSTRGSSGWNTYVPQSRFTARSWWNGGFYDGVKSENAYLLHDYGNMKFLLLSLEFGPRQGVLDWAKGLMTTYSDRHVIINTHSFMYRNGTRCSTGEQYNPHNYSMGSDVHDGEEMWAELKDYSNLLWVQNGHDINGTNVSVSARRIDAGTYGNEVKQIQANYQQFTGGGGGYLRIMTVKPRYGVAEIKTYSVTQDSYLTDDKEQFTYSFLPPELPDPVLQPRFGPIVQTLF